MSPLAAVAETLKGIFEGAAGQEGAVKLDVVFV